MIWTFQVVSRSHLRFVPGFSYMFHECSVQPNRDYALSLAISGVNKGYNYLQSNHFVRAHI